MDFEFRPRVGVTVIAVFAALVLTALATWQIARFLEKSELEDEWNRRQAEAPVQLRDLADFDANALDFRRAVAHGALDESRVAVFDNHRFRAEPGCLIASPLALTGGGTVIVIRGFVPHTRQQRCTEATISPAGHGPWNALVHTVRPNLADTPHRDQRGASQQWDTLDIDGAYAAWEIHDGPGTSTVLVLDEDHVGDPFPLASFEHVSAPYLTSMRHLNYAGTWLISLLLLAGLWGGMSMRRVPTA